MTIRVLLADDQALLRATLRLLIDSCDDMEVVDEATDGAQAIELTRTHRPDVVLLDVRMPGTDVLTVTSALCGDPELSAVRVLILTTSELDRDVARALAAGASGFLGTDVTADAFLEGVRTVTSGQALLSPLATRALITRFLANPTDEFRLATPEDLVALSAREREVLGRVAEGRSDAEIAERLGVDAAEVRAHIHQVRTKLGARDRAQLVVIAHQSGLLGAAPPLLTAL
ncbi:response regulator [Streptomyces cadmiisoli]|uniref:response regulator n=1 Tax=Streptomyces cadmiisoli TaxID=2184053 RepID=UPI00365CBEB1